MAQQSKIRVAVVGLGFGRAFVPIYHSHPDVEYVGICDADGDRLSQVGDGLHIERRHRSLEEALASDDYDAVHLLTPIPLHTEQAIAVLGSGKHCACAVPMATNLDDLRAVLDAQRRAKKNYMMMETVVYSREFLFVKDLYEKGVLGSLQFLRGAHYQDMENWPAYWDGFPPMHYATHALAPLLALTGARVARVSCLGSGRMREAFRKAYDNPYPIETAILQLEGAGVAAEITRSLVETAVQYKESFDVYGDKATFQWEQFHGRQHALVTLLPAAPDRRGRGCTVEPVDPPFRPDLLPEELAAFAAGGHGGSHPHLVHEFVRSIVEGRRPAIDAVSAADWCAPGICAHESALKGGEPVTVPRFGSEGEMA
jgi:predicted dehydrogenase